MAGASILQALLLVALIARSSAAPVAVSSVASTTSTYLPDARLADGKPCLRSCATSAAVCCCSFVVHQVDV